MKQEYLFTGNEHRTELEKYTHETAVIDIRDIAESDCWVISFYMEGQNRYGAKILSEVNEYIIDKFNPIVLSDESSAYFNKDLYPHFNEFERHLRKLLYLKSALSDATEDAKVIKDLESKDFGKIFELLFSDEEFVKEVRTTINNKTWQFAKLEVLESLQDIPENTLWDRLIGEDITPVFRLNFIEVRKIRNDVMHAHSMNHSSYQSALALIKTINGELTAEIEAILSRGERAQKPQINKDFNDAISKAIESMEATIQETKWSEYLASYLKISSILEKNKTRDMFTDYINLSPVADVLRQQSKAFQKTQLDLPALEKFKEMSVYLKQFQKDLPELIELKKSLQTLMSSPAIAELIREKNIEEKNDEKDENGID